MKRDRFGKPTNRHVTPISGVLAVERESSDLNEILLHLSCAQLEIECARKMINALPDEVVEDHNKKNAALSKAAVANQFVTLAAEALNGKYRPPYSSARGAGT